MFLGKSLYSHSCLLFYTSAISDTRFYTLAISDHVSFNEKEQLTKPYPEADKESE